MYDVDRPEAQSHTISDTHSVTPDPREDVPHALGATKASERTRQDLPDSPTTVLDPELPRHGERTQGTAHAPREHVSPSPTTLLIEQADQGVREAVEGITALTEYEKKGAAAAEVLSAWLRISQTDLSPKHEESPAAIEVHERFLCHLFQYCSTNIGATSDVI